MALLKAKQLCFVNEYLKDFNGTQAAIRAGYSPKTARSIASELLKKTSIAATVERYKWETAKASEISRQATIAELMKIGFADIGILMDKNGKMKPPQEWTAEMAEVVESFRFVQHYSGTGKNRILKKTTFTVKMKDKIKALGLLLDHLGAPK